VSQDLEGLRQEMDAAIEATTAEAEAGKFEAEREAETLRRRVAAIESELAASRQMSEAATEASKLTVTSWERRCKEVGLSRCQPLR